MKQQSELARQAENPEQGPKLDLGFKEGQTIKLNIAVRSSSSSIPPFPWVEQEEAAACPQNPCAEPFMVTLQAGIWLCYGSQFQSWVCGFVVGI